MSDVMTPPAGGTSPADAAKQAMWRPLPDHTQLPESDGAIVENFQEHPQSILLTDAILPVLRTLHPDGQFCIGQNSGIYWEVNDDDPLKGCKAPDWFYVPNVPPMLEGKVRRSYVKWKELMSPRIVIELVSGTGREERDRTPRQGKFWVYEQAIAASNYAIFEFDPGRVEVYRLDGGTYQLVPPNAHGHYPIRCMGVALGIWRGRFAAQELPWLRWFDLEGNLIPISDEIAERERQRADQESERADQESERADQESERADQERRQAEQERHRADRGGERVAKLEKKLRDLGISPDEA